MRNKRKINWLTLFTTMLMLLTMMRMFVYPINAVTVEKVNLLTTSNFALLAGESITHTGAIVLNGDAGNDIGLHPGTAFDPTGVTMVGGTVYIADAVASQAKDDLITAYNDAASRTTTTTITADLGGMTLTPGVYTKADGLSIAEGTTLTLDAQGDPNAVFIFQSGSTLVTGVGSTVLLTNEARYCRTFWQVGSSATLGANSVFTGHILASVSITAGTDAFVQGQLLASSGSITLDANTITNGECADETPTTTDGGTLPVTSTFLWKSVIIGSGLVMVGILGILIRKHYIDIEIDEQEEE